MTISSPPSIHLYAELLVHINTVSLHGSIDAPDTSESTTAKLSTEGPLVRVTHAESTAILELPVNTNAATSSTVQLPAGKPKEFAARLQVEAEDGAHIVSLREDVESETPWGAKDLSGETRLCCGGCGNDIVNSGESAQREGDARSPRVSMHIREWKDLPSDNWAEMMDFWHCHKPVNHKKSDANGNASSQKGYAASNTLQAVSGVGLVDTSSFLFAPEDVTSVQVVSVASEPYISSPTSPQSEQLICASSTCANLLGHVDARASGYRLYKWAIAVSPKPSTEPRSFPAEQWITTQMLSMLEAESIRKFIVTRPAIHSQQVTRPTSENSEQEESWLLWLFTPDLRFCSSASPPLVSDATTQHSSTLLIPNNQTADNNHGHPAKSIRACKILYRRLPSSSPSDPPTTSSSSKANPSSALDPPLASNHEESLILPGPLNTALFEALFASAALLPRAARTYGPWTVGLLRRFGRDDVAVGRA